MKLTNSIFLVLASISTTIVISTQASGSASAASDKMFQNNWGSGLAAQSAVKFQLVPTMPSYPEAVQTTPNYNDPKNQVRLKGMFSQAAQSPSNAHYNEPMEVFPEPSLYPSLSSAPALSVGFEHGSGFKSALLSIQHSEAAKTLPMKLQGCLELGLAESRLIAYANAAKKAAPSADNSALLNYTRKLAKAAVVDQYGPLRNAAGEHKEIVWQSPEDLTIEADVVNKTLAAKSKFEAGQLQGCIQQ